VFTQSSPKPLTPRLAISTVKMGWYDYLSDLTSSLTVQSSYAEEDARQFSGPVDKSGEQNAGKDASSGGIGTAQQDRGATTKGGVSLDTPASGTDEESSSEKEANEADAQKQKGKGGEPEKGHTPGEGGAGSGQTGPGAAGPYGGSVKSGAADGGQEGENQEGGAEPDDEEEEEEEDEEEPEDPKQKLEDGESAATNFVRDNLVPSTDKSPPASLHPAV